VPGLKKAVRFYVSGLVQGVGYRYFARHVAQQLGVAGYVKNLNDGRVEVLAIGAEAQLRALLEDLRKGPPGAFVEEIAETSADIVKEFESDFSIAHDY
jgi:acylphosphatase